MTFDQLCDALLEEYDVDIDECSRELRVLLDDMTNQGLIQESPPPPCTARDNA